MKKDQKDQNKGQVKAESKAREIVKFAIGLDNASGLPTGTIISGRKTKHPGLLRGYALCLTASPDGPGTDTVFAKYVAEARGNRKIGAFHYFRKVKKLSERKAKVAAKEYADKTAGSATSNAMQALHGYVNHGAQALRFTISKNGRRILPVFEVPADTDKRTVGQLAAEVSAVKSAYIALAQAAQAKGVEIPQTGIILPDGLKDAEAGLPVKA